MDAKTGVVSFDTKDLDMSKNEGASLVNNLVGSKNTFDFTVGPTIMTDKGPVRIDKISYDLANLPTFGDQPKSGNPPSGVSDIVGLFLSNPNITRVSNTNFKVAPEWTVAFHELAEAYAKIDGGMGGSYAAGHNAALQREMTLRDQRPYLKQYNTGSGGPANSPNPEGGDHHQEMTMRILKQLVFLSLVLFLAMPTGHATTLVVQKEISVSRALTGHVLVRGTEEPANGVTVELCSADWKTVFKSTKTDEKGHFELEQPATGKLFYIRVSAPGMDIYELRVRIKKQAAKELTIRLSIAT